MSKTTKALIITLAVIIAAGVLFYFYIKFIMKQLTTAKQSPNTVAFLKMIRQCEGTAGAKGYNTLFGGKTFSDMSKHPNVRVPFRDTYSTAAGAYQILYGTYVRLAPKIGKWDFSPETQDLMALELIREKDALEDVVAGRVETAVYKVRKIWASLPGAGYNQPEKTIAQVKSFYTAAGGSIVA